MHPSKHERVLITGATGFIGANLVRALLHREADVYALVRSESALWRLSELLPRIHVVTAALTQPAELSSVVRQVEPQSVFHLAHPSGYPTEPPARLSMLQAGVLGTANLLEAVRPIELRRFVHLGSSLEYGPRSEPLRESDCLEPSTLRGVAKAAATLLCRQFARAAAYPVVVLRPFSVYGYWESRTRLVAKAILAALRGQEFNLTAPGYRHDLVFIEDVCEACLAAWEVEQLDSEVINVGSGQQWTNEEVVALVQALTGQSMRIVAGKHPASPSDTSHWVADIDKAKSLLGWAPRHTLRSGLAKTIEWFRAHEALYAVMDNRPYG